MKIFRLLILLLACPLWAQTDKITDSILRQSAFMVFSDRVKGEKHAQFVLQSQPRGDKAARAFLVLADAAYLKGDFQAAVKNLSAAEKINTATPETIVLTKLYLAHYYRLFGFKDLALQQKKQALELLKNVPQNNAAAELWARYYLGESESAAANEIRIIYLRKAETNLRQSNNPEKSALDYQVQVALGSGYAQPENFPAAAGYLEPLINEEKQSVFKAQAWLILAMMEKSLGKPTSQSLFEAVKILDICTDVPTQKEVYKALAEDFLKAGNAAQYKKYLGEFQGLDNRLTHETKAARDSVIANLEHSQTDSAQSHAYYFLAAAVLLLLLGYGLYAYHKTKRDYRKFLKAVEKPMASQVQPARPIAISQKTEETLLEKLSKFEKSNKFINPNLTIQTLAKSLDTNTKYLSEVINRNKNANFNQYINELRIGYIITKMKEDPKYLNYKIYYLAKESGFASQNTFSTVFKAATGISPLSFIKFLKNEKSL